MAPPRFTLDPLPGFLERVVGGHVTSPRGFRAASGHCGVKASGPDLVLLLSEFPAAAAGVFTRSAVVAAPVVLSRRILRGRRARAIVCNSGNANACTGERGTRDALAMAGAAAAALALASEEVLVASTGVIGRPLPIEKITRGVGELAAAVRERADEAARQREGREAAAAIMTTDTFPKTAALRVDLGGGEPAVIGGIAKGAGMIEPDLATTLGFVTTDAAIAGPALDEALRQAADRSFNTITVDGDTSTNDCLLVIANGQVATPVAAGPALERFAAGLERVLLELALLVVGDGEGATRAVRIEVVGAGSAQGARQVAKTIANSPLVKTALHSGEPNWGRLMMAIGRSGVPIDERRVAIYLDRTQIVAGGLGLFDDLKAVAAELAKPEVHIRVDLGLGDGAATVYTCDLSAEYVRINASYIS